MRNFLSNILIKWLSQPSSTLFEYPTHGFEILCKTLKPGDILLLEGKQRFSTVIKYFTQSNWSHSALYIGDDQLIEADIKDGVRLVPLRFYQNYHTRICRPVGLDQKDTQTLISTALSFKGKSYDLKNVFDLAKYLFPLPFVPNKWKRRVLEFGSGDPSKVICSSFLADVFQNIHYPIAPYQVEQQGDFHLDKRHPTLFTPSDFDRSPYFQIIKPTLTDSFNFKKLNWK